MTPEERADSVIANWEPGTMRTLVAAAIRAAENDALEDFAQFLLEHRPSAAQIKISPEYNEAVLAAFGWAANEARKRIQ